MKKFDWNRFAEWICQWGISLFGYALIGSFLFFLLWPVWIAYWQLIEGYWGIDLSK